MKDTNCSPNSANQAFSAAPRLLKLFVAQCSIEFYAFSKAAIGALILGKVVLVMDWAGVRRRANNYPRAVVIVCKTFMYGSAVIVLGIGERMVHSIREAGNLRDRVRLVIANADLDRFLGLVLLISLIVGSYLVMQEIDARWAKELYSSFSSNALLISVEHEDCALVFRQTVHSEAASISVEQVSG